MSSPETLPLVSLIIPTYKRADRLAAAVESALGALTDANRLEVVVVDDCSPDNTAEVCLTLEGRHPAVRTVRRAKNGGLSRARNTGMEVARGQFIAFLDDDDWRLPGSLDGQIARLLQEPEAVICYGPVRFVDDATGEYTGEIYPLELPEGDIFWPLFARCFLQVPSIVLRRTLLPEGDLFNADRPLVEDWEAWLRLTETHPCVAVAEPVAGYRLPQSGSGQLSSNPARMATTSSRLQRQLLAKLPRAAGDPARALMARKQFLDWTVPWLYGHMLNALRHRNGSVARSCWRGMWELQPRFALRRRVLRALGATWLPALTP